MLTFVELTTKNKLESVWSLILEFKSQVKAVSKSKRMESRGTKTMTEKCIGNKHRVYRADKEITL